MNKLSRHNLLTATLATLALILLLAVANYIQSPSTPQFQWQSINPWELLSGIAFALSFGFGFPLVLSIAVIIVTIVLVWLLLYFIIRKFVK